jgi:trans-aconitate methyltransferase
VSGNTAVCRVCAGTIETPAFDHPGPSLTSIRTVLDLPTQVFLCPACGHAQSPDLPDLKEFYDTQYRISLDIDGHDQLYENSSGEQVFRTDYQAELVEALDIPRGARVLDFGAGKATTLRKVLARRPDLVPHVFDVSEDYVEHWKGWVPSAQAATYELPDAWTGHFDLITAHFVLEHVPEPVSVFRALRRCLAPDGTLFFTIPDAETNSGDFLVIDHLNHFSRSSLTRALGEAGLVAERIDQTAFAGAFAVTARAGVAARAETVNTLTAQSSLDAWSGILDRLSAAALTPPVAIYGAGFYGSLAAARRRDVTCFLDRNPYLQGKDHMGVSILGPEDCPPEVRSVLAALNPARAREILGDAPAWLPEGAKLVYLDD